LDPVLGTEGDFDLFDFALLSIDNSCLPKVLFVPSSKAVQTNHTIATIGYPGVEAIDSHHMNKVVSNSNYRGSLPPFPYLKQIFFGFGQKCVSIGTVSGPYALDGEEWKELPAYTYSKTDHAIISHETVFFGNSGGPVICLNTCEVHTATDVHGHVWTLVEYIGTRKYLDIDIITIINTVI
jgi:outer membrane protein assembly factor BamB